MFNLELVVWCEVEAVLELFLPDGLIHLLELQIVLAHNLMLVLLIDESVHVLCCVMRDAHNVLVEDCFV